MIVLRIKNGIRDHFRERWCEWMLASVLISWGLIVLEPAEVMVPRGGYAYMRMLLPEQAWGWLAIAVGAVRCAALLINGTFAKTWWGRFSPHVRTIMCAVSGILWMIMSYSLWLGETHYVSLGVFPWFVVAEWLNATWAQADGGKLKRVQHTTNGADDHASH